MKKLFTLVMVAGMFAMTATAQVKPTVSTKKADTTKVAKAPVKKATVKHVNAPKTVKADTTKKHK